MIKASVAVRTVFLSLRHILMQVLRSANQKLTLLNSLRRLCLFVFSPSGRLQCPPQHLEFSEQPQCSLNFKMKAFGFLCPTIAERFASQEAALTCSTATAKSEAILLEHQ